MKYLKKGIFILSVLLFNYIIAQSPSVVLYGMTYIDGTSIPLGGTIEIESGDNVRIQFAINVDNPNGFEGTLKVFTKKTSSSNPIQRGGSETIFSGTTFFVSSRDIILEASEFNPSGGKLYAEFETTGGVKYVSGNYNISVYVDQSTDTDGDGIPDNEDDCPNEAGPASNNGCPEPDPCLLDAPSDRIITNITINSATLNWSPVTGSDGYNVLYRVTGSNDFEIVSLSSNTSSYTFTNLMDNTTYTYRIRTRCSNGEYGNWNPNEEFTTLEAVCNLNPPATLTSSNIVYNSAEISWTDVSGNDGYESEYKKATDNTWITVSQNNPNTSFILNNLQELTTYQWRVRTRCSNSIYGNWSSAANFTTPKECITSKTLSQEVFTSLPLIEEVSNSIRSFAILNPNTNVTYSAGQNIKLLARYNPFTQEIDAFHAKAGSHFIAKIEGCTNDPMNRIHQNENHKDEAENNVMTIESQLQTIKIFPNPTSSQITITSEEPMQHLTLSSHIGRTYVDQKIDKKEMLKTSLRLDNLPTGIYFLKVLFQNGETVTKQVVKK